MSGSGDPERIRGAYARQGIRWQDDRYRSWMPGNIFIAQERERVMLGLLRQHGFLPLDDLRILDVGCGPGKVLLRLLSMGALPENLFGVDLLEDEIGHARHRSPHLDFRVMDASRLPFPDGMFDLVLAFTSLSSMPAAAMRTNVAREMRRVLAPEGGILVYDFWTNRRNPDVHPIGKRELGALFPDCEVDARRVTLAPPVARVVAPRSWLACALLDSVPFLRTHWLSLLRPRA